MLLAILLTAVALSYYPWLQDGTSVFITAVQPGYLDFDNLPETNFSCERKVIGGYYADVETGCQMFHVCTIGQKSEVTDIKFLCLNGTVFDQETRVCERLDEVDCSKSESFFDLNLELYGNNAQGQGIQPEDGNEEHTTECEDPESGCGNEMEYPDEETTALSITSTTSTSTTPKPFITTTTTRRPSSTTLSKFHQDSISYSPTTQDTVAQLLALHEAFQESLKRTTVKPNVSKATTIFNSVLDTRNRFPNSQKTTLSPVPPKLPSTVTNLSRNNNVSGLNNFKNSYNPPRPNTSSNKNSQKVSNRPDVTFTPPNIRNQQPVGHGILQSSRNTPYTSRPVSNPISLLQIHHNADSIKSNIYDSTSFQNNFYPSSNNGNTRPAPFQLFKIEQPQSELQYSTPSILQGRPFSLHLVQESESNSNKDTEIDDYEEARPFASHYRIERVDEKPNSQSHSSITRAIGTKDTKTANNITSSADKMVSVVLSTSSVSSSKSFMLPSSAIIHKNNTPIVNTTKINNLQSSTNEPENIEFVYEDEYEYEDTDTATPLYTDVPKIKLL